MQGLKGRVHDEKSITLRLAMAGFSRMLSVSCYKWRETVPFIPKVLSLSWVVMRDVGGENNQEFEPQISIRGPGEPESLAL